jgi:Trypsin-co-occurring domain 1
MVGVKAVELTLSPEQLVAGVKKIAKDISPALKAGFSELGDIAVQEVSIGCAISATGGIVVAGVGAEASLTITFKVS